MSFKKIALTTITIAMALSASACRTGSSGGTNTGGGTGNVYHQPWYDVYGYVCGYDSPQAGCNFYSDGSKVYATEDPNYSDANWNANVQYGDWTYIDSYGNYASYSGWAWLSSTGVLYDDYGYALNSDEDQQSRDLIGDAAAKEEVTIKKAGKSFAQKFALAEATGVKIARTLNQMATLPKRLKRARNDADMRDFTKRLYGVDLDRAMAAADKASTGDMSDMKALNADVAANWGTQPETSEAILRGWYSDMLTN